MVMVDVNSGRRVALIDDALDSLPAFQMLALAFGLDLERFEIFRTNGLAFAHTLLRFVDRFDEVFESLEALCAVSALSMLERATHRRTLKPFIFE